MAGELKASGLGIGSGPYYARVFNGTGQVWTGAAFASLGTGSFAASTKVPITDPESSDSWTGDAPNGSITAGAASYEIRQGDRAGALVTDPIVWEDELEGAGTSSGGTPVSPAPPLPQLEIQFKVGGVLTDVTSSVLADAANVYGVKRDDTDAVIVAAGVAMTHVSTGVYRYTFTDAIPGVTYTWVAHLVYAGADYYFPRTFTFAADSWHYSNRLGVQTLIDDDTLAIVWDMNGDGTEDAGLLASDGVTSDGYIDLFLSSEGIAVPVNLATAAAHVVKALADVSNHLTVFYGWHHRGMQELSNATGKSADDIAGLMSGYKKYADMQLEKIAEVIAASVESTVSGTGRITAVVADAKIYPGTGRVLIPSITVPAPRTPFSV